MQPHAIQRRTALALAAWPDKEVQDRLLGAGAIARFENPAQMGQRIAQDYQRWGQIIRDKGISQE